MLRVDIQENDSCVAMTIEGRFVGRFAEDVRDLMFRKKLSGPLVVDLSNVSYVDEAGEEVLIWLSRIGAKFVTDNAYSSDVCTRLTLPLFSISRPALKRNGHRHSNHAAE
jgi:hypothetical protein